MPHGSDTLLLQLLIIFVAAKLFGEIFERLSLPAVLGEILAGVVFGPYAVGLVHPSDTVTSIAELGAIFLLFTTGLETPPHELIRVGRQALRVAIAGVAVPFVLGYAYLKLHGEPQHEAIFVAAAMVATSVGITARVMSDMRVLGTRVAKIILGAAVFDDILGMIILAVVAGVAKEGGVQWLHLGIVTAEAVAFALLMMFVGPRVVRRFGPRVERMYTRDAPLALALAICLGLSVASTKIGMAAIIGAFFAGQVFAERAPEWKLHSAVHGIHEFLVPFFFFVMGAKLNIQMFTSEVLVVSIVISVLALISKIIGCGLPVIREGMLTSLRVGVGMMPRGEVALIVALIGLQMNMIGQRAYAVVIFMTAVTTIMAPPLLRVLFRKEAPVSAPIEVEEVQEL